MEETINRSSTQSERREEAKQVEQQRREEDGQSSEKTARQEGDTSEVGDGSEIALETLQHRWTSIKLPPPSPFCLIILLSRRGEQRHAASLALSAAATFTPHEDESVEGFAADPTMGGSQRRSGRRVILSLEYHRTPTRATGSGLMWQPYCPVYRHSHKRNLRLL